jgi:Zn-dependent M28 family amino/carboxypeptidase
MPNAHRERPPLSAQQTDLREALRRDVEVLAGDIGPRNAWCPEGLDRALRFLEQSLTAAGHAPRRQTYRAEGRDFHNLEVEVAGAGPAREIVIVGAHYDSVAVDDCPGANDNGTGVAAVLALARRFAPHPGGAPPERTLRLVLFVNEEPPFFRTGAMGSRVHARRCRARREKVVAMFSLETMGYFSERPGSQSYPPMVGRFYPDAGNFIAFVGNLRSRALVRRALRSFRRGATIPAVGAALPGWLPGIGWSDHWSFWKEGYQAVMVTDTAPFRYPHYHTARDTVDQVDFDSLARVVDGLEGVLEDLTAGR